MKKEQPKKQIEKSIDRVDINSLDALLRMCDIKLSPYTIDKIIDCVELLEIKGRETTINDVVILKGQWEVSFNNLSHNID